MILEQLIVIFFLGIFTGTLNTIAGGGSLISLPLLIYFGLPPNEANATNRIGILAYSLVAAIRFHKRSIVDVKDLSKIALPACVGALLGSYLSIDISKEVIGIIILCCSILIFFDRNSLIKSLPSPKKTTFLWWHYFIIFFIGLYGGYFQAGVGLIIITMFHLIYNMNIVKINAYKVSLVSLFTIPSLIVFINYDLIRWQPGLTLACGSLIGGYLGTHLIFNWVEKVAKTVLIVLLVVSVTYLFS